MGAVFKREMRTFYQTPIGYVVMAVVFLLSGLFFYAYNLRGGSTALTGVFSALFYVVLIVLPLLTMRMFSEEKRQRTDQALLTAPVSLMGIVAGKFLATFLFFASILSITLVYGVVIATQVTPDWMVIFGNFFGTLLLGGMVIAAGLFFSCLTESQIIAVIITIAFSVALMMVDMFASLLMFSPWLAEAVAFFSVNTRYAAFTQGLIHYDNVFYFISLIVLFLFLTARTLDAKRWN